MSAPAHERSEPAGHGHGRRTRDTRWLATFPLTAAHIPAACASSSFAFRDMVEEVRSTSNAKLLDVARSFAQFLSLSNTAENHHRVRKLRESSMAQPSGLWDKHDSCFGTVRRLAKADGRTTDEIMDALCSQQVCLHCQGGRRVDRHHSDCVCLYCTSITQ